MAITTFTFNNISSTTYEINVVKLKRPILPPTRDRHEVVATRHGEYDFGPYWGPITIELDCWISVIDRPTLNALLDQIAVWLNPLAGTQRLVISDQPDRYWLARYSGKLDATLIGAGYAEFTIPFYCANPIAQPV